MKKRIFMLAMIAALVLSSVASALAENEHWFFNLQKGGVENVTATTANGTTTITFTAKVEYEIAKDDDTSQLSPATALTEANGWYKNANLLKITVGSEKNVFTATTFKINDTDVEDEADPYVVIDNTVASPNSTWKAGSNGTFTASVVATGTITDDTVENIPITLTLYSASDPTSAITEYDSSATYTKKDSIVENDGDTEDPRDPDSKKWDGLDPVFLHSINTDSYDYGKTKPALGKVDKSKLTFKAGTEGTLVVPMTGPIEEFNVYIAGKDAVKLYGLEKGADDIPLTSDNIKQYNIPFRVTAVTSTDTVKGKDAKEMAKNWKAAKDSVTIAFNGGKVQYKGFPLTFSMANGNTSSKPVAKTLKIDVTPNTAVPAWVASVKSTDKIVDGKPVYVDQVTTTDADEYAALVEDGYEDYKDSVDGWTLYLDEDGNSVEVTYNKGKPNNTPEVEGKTFSTGKDAGIVDKDADTDYWYEKYTTYYVKKDYTKYVSKKLGKKDPLLEISAALFPEGGYDGDAEDKGGHIPETVYAVSADGPYLITYKAPKDEGVTIDVAQASFDYLGNVTAAGTVTIGGTLSNTDKENKQAITLTVTNPSTKKKAAIKVTVIGKTAPTIQKTEAFKFSEDDTDDKARKQLSNIKNVEAGKTPSVKYKATGSKTIEYRLGAYTSYFDSDNALVVEPDDEEIETYLEALSAAHEGDEAYEEYAENRFSDEKYADMSTAEAFNAELVTKLTALGLSFDKAKGAVILANKSKKETKPTLDYTGDAFEPLRIVVTAVNGAGTDQAWADLGITGAKPKVSDKQVSIKGAVKKGDTFKFKLLAGKVAAEKGTVDNSSNVKATDTDGALGDYGLALVTYDSMDVLVPATVHFDANATIPAYDATKNTIVQDETYAEYYEDGSLKDHDDTPVITTKVDDVTTYKAGSHGVTLISGDKWVKSADLSLKNYGIIQVVNPATLAEAAADNTNKINKGVSVNLTLENFGATAKGKIKVAVDAKTSNGGDPATATNGALPGSNAALPNNAAAPAATAKTNGTASITYNGAAPEADADESAEDVTVTVGAPRTAADLTAGQQAFLAGKGLKVIAVLPEISANVDGQQEFAVELDEDAPEGAKMVYVPFPQNAEATDDDNIADFYGADGEAIEEVPAEKDITVAPWLRADVVYQPVIAVEAE